MKIKSKLIATIVRSTPGLLRALRVKQTQRKRTHFVVVPLGGKFNPKKTFVVKRVVRKKRVDKK